MATCPTCQKHYPDGTHACADDGEALLPDEAFASMDRDLAAGQAVGEYRIERKIGEGGFGTVYSALHPLIGKTAAVKVLSRQYSSHPQMVARFISEARAVNQIRHRNIIDIFAFGALPDGRQYFVMELLDGMPLDRYLKQYGRLAPGLAVPILRFVGRALDAAHASGIAHRDLKPENIFLTFDDDGQPFPKLLDFGIAKLMSEAASGGGDRAKTKTGTPMGTPYYMSPEQCRGKDVDHRTDIYSFGVMAHELMTGELPFRGDDVFELMLKHTQQAPPTISQVVPELPSAIDAPVLRMLSKDPAERPPTLGAAVEELARAAKDAGLDVAVLPLRPPQRGEVGDRMPSGGKMTPAQIDSLGSASTIASLPTADSPAKTFQGAEKDVPASSKKTYGPRMLAAVSMLVVVGGIGAVWFGMSRSKQGPVAASSPGAPLAATSAAGGFPQPAAPAVAVAPADESREVAVTIQSTPEHAAVLRDGKRIGEAPGPILLPRGEGIVHLVVRAEGYRPTGIKVGTNKDSTHEVTLVKAAKAPLGKPGRAETKGEIPGSIDEK